MTATPQQLVSAGGEHPTIGVDAKGRGVLAWVEAGSASTPLHIRALRFVGGTLNPSFRVDSQPLSVPRHPRLALDGRGSFIVVWSTTEVRGQLFGANGQPRGGELVLSPLGIGAAHPEVGMARDGRFAVAWEQSHPDPTRAVQFATFNVAGRRLGGPLTMPAVGVDANLVGAVSASAGSVVVGWTEFTPCPSNPLDPVSAVATFRWSMKPLRATDRLANDNPCIDGPQVLAIPNSDLGPLGIFVGRRYSIQRFSAVDGTRIGLRINVAELPPCSSNACERVVAVAGDPSGRFVFIWERFRNGHYDLFAELYGREGQVQVAPFQVNLASSAVAQHPAAAFSNNGRLVVAWHRAGEGLLMRRFQLP